MEAAQVEVSFMDVCSISHFHRAYMYRVYFYLDNYVLNCEREEEGVHKMILI